MNFVVNETVQYDNLLVKLVTSCQW